MKETIVALIAGKVKASTKWCLGALLALPAIAQIPQVTSLLSAHPKIAATVGTLVSIGALLHNPVVAKLVGLTQTETKSVQVGDTTVTASSSTTVTTAPPTA